MSHTYVLLVGINAYPVKPLAGCLNDVRALRACLESLYGSEADGRISFKILTDETELKPTRANLVGAFEFFDQAVDGDTCLFYYSGHGSYGLAPSIFRSPSGFLQSFVCLDSRTPGGRDLLDKEMAFLIWKATLGKPGLRFIAITDCCHSGTITKAPSDGSRVRDRMLPPPVERSVAGLADFFGYDFSKDGLAGYMYSADGTQVSVRRGPHIHLSASRADQTAKELLVEGVRHGAFTALLIKTLYRFQGKISYEQLAESLQAAVANLVRDQQPGIQVNGELPLAAVQEYFLGGQGTVSSPYLVYYDQVQGWCVCCGLLQQVAAGDEFVLPDGGVAQVSGAPGVDMARLRMPAGVVDVQEQFWGKLRRRGVRAARLYFDPGLEQSVKDWLGAALEANGPGLIALSAEGGELAVRLLEDGSAALCRPGEEAPLFRPVVINDAATADYFLSEAEKIVRWRRLLELDNATNPLGKENFEIKVYRGTLAGSLDPLTFTEIGPAEGFYPLYYQKQGGQWFGPGIRISVRNRSDRPLWVTNAYLGFDFGIGAQYFEDLEIGANRTAWLSFREEDPQPDGIFALEIDPKISALGYTSIREYLKLFVSRERITLTGIEQPGVELPAPKAPAAVWKAVEPSKPWTTVELGFSITKAEQAVEISGSAGAALGGLRIQGPAGFRAAAGLRSSAELSRSPDGTGAPGLAFYNSDIAPWDLSAGHRDALVMDVLELTEVAGSELVSREDPLVISLGDTGAQFHILPLGYDPESGLYYPLGSQNEAGDICLENLPAQTAFDEALSFRSLTGSFRIYFQKVISGTFGTVYPYPRLAVAEIDEDRQVQYLSELEVVRTRVAAASKILLFVHGIIGDTASIAPCVKTCFDNGGRMLADCCDLVLTFDYENLNTPIGENAALLLKKLNEVGFTEGHGKELIIIAHSMGGLVSRIMIEKCGGGPLVSRLIMLGTPNNGTPWADVRDLAGALATFAINGSALLQPWLFAISAVGRLVQGVQVTLKEMNAETGIYAELNKGKDPGVPYTIIAGDTRDISASYAAASGLITRLLQRGVYDALDAVLFNEPNDIAVADRSITTLEGTESWVSKPVLEGAACDHLNYFVLPAVLQLLAAAIG
jgi:pimeloyl-ACP methyl ester carboxylesterase